MKKIFSIILCAAVVLTTGCSGVSQEEYNSLVEENEKLKSEAEQLEEELEELEASKGDADNCFDIYAKMLSLPKTAISEVLPNQHSSGLYEEDTFYSENGELSAKVIMTFDSSLSAEDITPYIKVHIDGVKNTVGQLLQSSLAAHVCIYRYNDGNVIMSQCWYKEDDGNVKAPMFFTSYGEDVAKILTRLYQEEENSVQ